MADGSAVRRGAVLAVEYSEALALEICERVAEGETLLDICDEAGMPSRGSIYRWLIAYPAFGDNYARAKEEQGHVFAERAVSIAMKARDPQLGRLQMDGCKWYAGKLNGKYSDRQTLEHTGPGGQPLMIITGVPDVILEGEYTQVDEQSSGEGPALNTSANTSEHLTMRPDDARRADAEPDRGGTP
jgi:hypothetical protein